MSNPRLHPLDSRETPALYGPAQTCNDLGPTINLGSFDDAVDVATADFNRDGHPDLVTVRLKGSATSFLNDGAGGFRTHSLLSNGGDIATHGTTVRTGDFKGDGNPDAAVHGRVSDSTTLQLRVFRGDGTGGFDAGTRVATTEESVVPLAVADLDGDGPTTS